jgi:hypothetical protein
MQSYNDTKQSIAFGDYGNFLSSFSALWSNGTAQEHVWYFCAQAYNINITNRVVSQNVTNTWRDGTFPSSYNPTTGIDTGSVRTSANDYSILGPQLPGSSSPQLYNVSTNDIIVLSMFLQNLTQGVGMLGNASYGGDNTMEKIGLSFMEFSQPSIQRLYSAGNLTSVVSNIAGTMTNVVRTGLGFIPIPADPVASNPKLGNLDAVGTAYSYQTFIEVRWPWFILSLVLAIGGLVFLLGTVIVNRREETTPWKNNALAMLMHGLDPQLRGEFGRMEKISEMEGVAEGTVLRLQVTSDGLKLLS